jgi:hypothetical protein
MYGLADTVASTKKKKQYLERSWLSFDDESHLQLFSTLPQLYFQYVIWILDLFRFINTHFYLDRTLDSSLDIIFDTKVFLSYYHSCLYSKANQFLLMSYFSKVVNIII